MAAILFMMLFVYFYRRNRQTNTPYTHMEQDSEQERDEKDELPAAV